MNVDKYLSNFKNFATSIRFAFLFSSYAHWPNQITLSCTVCHVNQRRCRMRYFIVVIL